MTKQKFLFSIGITAIFVLLPLISQASSYCGERVCHSYDSSGACNNYTCFGDGYYPGFSRSYGRPERYYGYYDYDNDYDCAGCAYSGARHRTASRYYNDDYYYPTRYVTYRNSNTYRSARSSYYYDDYYYPRYDDRIYVPKAGYYYRY